MKHLFVTIALLCNAPSLAWANDDDWLFATETREYSVTAKMASFRIEANKTGQESATGIFKLENKRTKAIELWQTHTRIEDCDREYGTLMIEKGGRHKPEPHPFAFGAENLNSLLAEALCHVRLSKLHNDWETLTAPSETPEIAISPKSFHDARQKDGSKLIGIKVRAKLPANPDYQYHIVYLKPADCNKKKKTLSQATIPIPKELNNKHLKPYNSPISESIAQALCQKI